MKPLPPGKYEVTMTQEILDELFNSESIDIEEMNPQPIIGQIVMQTDEGEFPVKRVNAAPYTWSGAIEFPIFSLQGNSVIINYEGKPCMSVRVAKIDNPDDREGVILYVEDLVKQLNHPHYIMAITGHDQQLLDDAAVAESQDLGEDE